METLFSVLGTHIHGGVVFDSLLNSVDKFGPELLIIQAGLLVIVFTLFLWLWFSNRRKYHNLKHAIPANVVKGYLDSIIQNSTSLKSSLFRGGGAEVNGIPSVMPLQNLVGGDNLGMNGAPSTALLEELNQRKAQLALLEGQAATSQLSQKELENKLNQAVAKIKELENLLAARRNEAGGDEGLKLELDSVTKERNEIRDRLKEFEIIADDLANLKRLQQENEQLKRSLAAKDGKAPQPMADVSDVLEDLAPAKAKSVPEKVVAAPEPDDVSIEEPEVKVVAPEELEALPTVESEAEVQAPEETKQAAAENPADEKAPASEKTPEDLLSEFEKMLG